MFFIAINLTRILIFSKTGPLHPWSWLGAPKTVAASRFTVVAALPAASLDPEQPPVNFILHSGWATTRQFLHFTAIFPKRILLPHGVQVSGRITCRRRRWCVTASSAVRGELKDSYRFRQKHVFQGFPNSARIRGFVAQRRLGHGLDHGFIAGKPHGRLVCGEKHHHHGNCFNNQSHKDSFAAGKHPHVSNVISMATPKWRSVGS